MSPSSSASLLTKALTAILNLLGWDHAQVGSKALDFAADFNVLGISVQQQLHVGSFVLATKEGGSAACWNKWSAKGPFQSQERLKCKDI